MRNQIDDGGQAFPDDGGQAFPSLCARSDEDGRGGMSLRDWFAGQALSGLVARPELPPLDDKSAAALVFAMADAMIAARKEQP